MNGNSLDPIEVKPVAAEEFIERRYRIITKMLVVNRIKFTMIHQIHHRRRFDHRHAIILEDGVDGGDKAIQVGHMGQHIIGQEDISPFTRFSQLGCQFTAEKSNQRGDTGRPGRFYLNEFGLHWNEVTASNLIEVAFDGTVVEGRGPADRSAICIHAPIHEATGAACVLHTHMPYATALTLTQARALDTTLSQNAMRFHGRLAIDAHYNGLALDAREGERIAHAMQGADVAFLGNHGVVVCGQRMDYAYDDLYYLERACMAQVLAQSTGMPLVPVAPAVAARVAQQSVSERLQGELFFEALRRTL